MKFLEYRSTLSADLRANSGHPKEQLIVTSLRTAQLLRGRPIVGAFANIAHRFWTEMFYGIELRPETTIGPGLKIFHGYATVVNTATVIGSNVKLHQGVTIGARHTGGGCPTIGSDVEIGAGAIIIGDIVIGAGGKIGAGAIVVKDVPTDGIAIGTAARVVFPAEAVERELK